MSLLLGMLVACAIGAAVGLAQRRFDERRGRALTWGFLLVAVAVMVFGG